MSFDSDVGDEDANSKYFEEPLSATESSRTMLRETHTFLPGNGCLPVLETGLEEVTLSEAVLRADEGRHKGDSL